MRTVLSGTIGSPSTPSPPLSPTAHRAAPRRRSIAVFALLLLWSAVAAAWSNHALGTWPALSVLPQVVDAAPVKAESLEDFLVAEAAALVPLLEREERWAREHVPTYPARPAELAFRAEKASPAELRRRFVTALRINPDSRLTLFLQVPPGQRSPRPPMAEADVTTLQRGDSRSSAFVALAPGEPVAVIDVIATASDEPDYGIDLGLWEDSGTEQGRRYGFGRQPFGANPAIEFASQAPFHMGFYHEARIIYKAAPFLQRTYAQYRIHLWRALAAHALANGHPYWGWRFAGWALHYVQDLTQPYHARVLPGVGVAGMLWINTLDLAGWHRPKQDAVTFVTNRHLALENYEMHRLRRAWLQRDPDGAPWRALLDTSRDAPVADGDRFVGDVVAMEASAYADEIDEVLERELPWKYTSDPAYVFGETEPAVDLVAVVAASGTAADRAMSRALAHLMGNFGTHTRGFVRLLAESVR